MPSTRTSPLGLHRSHCRVRRLGHATLGPHPWGQTTRPATQRWAADPVNVPRTAESEAAADSTGTTTQQPAFISTDYGPAPGDSGQTKLRNSDQEENHFMNPKNRTFDGSANRWVTTTSSGSPLQRFHPRRQSQAHTELLRPSSTSFFFRNPSLPLVSSPIPRPRSVTPIPPRLTAPVILPPSPLALAFPAGPGGSLT